MKGKPGLQNTGKSLISFQEKQKKYGIGIMSGPVTLKQKMIDLENMINRCTKELLFHIKEVGILRSEKDTLLEVLTMKSDDIKGTMRSELNRQEEELERHLKHQQSETQRFDF
jgi:hypothetical protein